MNMLHALLMVLGLALIGLALGITRRLCGPKSYKLANTITPFDPNGDVYKEGRITRLADAAITVRWSLVTEGATPGKTIQANTGGTIPIGIVDDTTDTLTNDLTIPLHVRLFGSEGSTNKVAINSTVAAGDFLIADSTTPIYAMTDPGTASTKVVQIGRALKGGVAGAVIDFAPNLRQFSH